MTVTATADGVTAGACRGRGGGAGVVNGCRVDVVFDHEVDFSGCVDAFVDQSGDPVRPDHVFDQIADILSDGTERLNDRPDPLDA